MAIAAAAMVAAAPVRPEGKERAKRIEAAMLKAVEDACAEGLNVDKDAALIRERMMAARESVLKG